MRKSKKIIFPKVRGENEKIFETPTQFIKESTRVKSVKLNSSNKRVPNKKKLTKVNPSTFKGVPSEKTRKGWWIFPPPKKLSPCKNGTIYKIGRCWSIICIFCIIKTKSLNVAFPPSKNISTTKEASSNLHPQTPFSPPRVIEAVHGGGQKDRKTESVQKVEALLFFWGGRKKGNCRNWC